MLPLPNTTLKVLQRTEYAPNNRPLNTNRRDWHNAYLCHLIEMYSLVIQELHEQYPDTELPRPMIGFHHFSRLIYHCSSKYITPYLDDLNTCLQEVQSNQDGKEN